MHAAGSRDEWSERLRDTRQRLLELQRLGYRYIATPDDGDTWVGSDQPGLDIGDLLRQDFFLGEVKSDGDARPGEG